MKGQYRWELFDLEKDSEEMNNLAKNPEYKALKETLKQQLRGLIKDLDDIRVMYSSCLTMA